MSSGGGSEGERTMGGSYEEQYAAFARQQHPPEQQQQKQQQQSQGQPQPLSQPTTSSSTMTATATQSEPSATVEEMDRMNRKAQEDLERAFLEFISCYPKVEFMGPPREDELEETPVSTPGNDETVEQGERETAAIGGNDHGGDTAATATATAESDVDGETPTSISNHKYYTVEVKVETTFPEGITVEGAKKGWLEFCWAKGGGIVVPAATTSSSTASTQAASSKSQSDSSTTNKKSVEDAPASIKFERASTKAAAWKPKDTVEETAPQESSREEVETHRDRPVLDLPTGIPSARELLVPFGLQQELTSTSSSTTLNDNDDDEEEEEEEEADIIQSDAIQIRRDVVTYKTTQSGFFCKDMIPGTHEGKVEFIGASYTSTRMIWTVTFQVDQDEDGEPPSSDTTTPTSTTPATTPEAPASILHHDAAANVLEFASHTKTMVEGYSKQLLESNPKLKTILSKANLWGSWSQFQLKTASQNLVAYLDNSSDAVPVLEHTETLPVGVSPRAAMEAWYDYYWKNGGGSLPVVTSSPASHGSSDKRWVIPSGLEEELVSLEYEKPVSESSGFVGVDGHITSQTEIAKAVYKVNNPNPVTYPVYHHRATVRFVRDGGPSNPTQLVWKVSVKPYRKFLGGGVLFWTKNGISKAAKSLRNYIELKQVEKRERQLQAQLERLRIENPSHTRPNTSSTATIDAQNDEKLPFQGFKTIRSTVSILPTDSSIVEKEASSSIVDDSDDNDVVEKTDGEPLQEDVEADRPTMPVSASSEEDRPTIPLSSSEEEVSTTIPLSATREEERPTIPLFTPGEEDSPTIQQSTSRDEDRPSIPIPTRAVVNPKSSRENDRPSIPIPTRAVVNPKSSRENDRPSIPMPTRAVVNPKNSREEARRSIPIPTRSVVNPKNIRKEDRRSIPISKEDRRSIPIPKEDRRSIPIPKKDRRSIPISNNAVVNPKNSRAEYFTDIPISNRAVVNPNNIRKEDKQNIPKTKRAAVNQNTGREDKRSTIPVSNRTDGNPKRPTIKPLNGEEGRTRSGNKRNTRSIFIPDDGVTTPIDSHTIDHHTHDENDGREEEEFWQ